MKMSVFAHGERAEVVRVRTGLWRSMCNALLKHIMADPMHCTYCRDALPNKEGICENCVLERQI